MADDFVRAKAEKTKHVIHDQAETISERNPHGNDQRPARLRRTHAV